MGRHLITVIGGSGFIGARLLESLSVSGLDFINLDIQKPSLVSKNFSFGDITDLSQVKTKFSGTEQIVNLAAKHKDNVKPIKLYYDVNVGGAEETVRVAEKFNIPKIVFTSSAAVYGLHRVTVSEETPFRPFNHYGKSKLQAEQVYIDWQKRTGGCLIIIRPTVVFGEGNRGNVYNLFRQLEEGNFMMIGSGENKKSMAYVGNIGAFIKYCSEEINEGLHIFNYSDGPDLTMNDLINIISNKLDKKVPTTRIPYSFGILGGYFFDALSFLTSKDVPVSSVRIKKFCANTQFSADRVERTGFKREFTLLEGLERTLNHEFNEMVLSK